MRKAIICLLLCPALLTGCGLTARSRAVDQLRPVETMGYDADGARVTVSASSGTDDPMTVAARGGSVPQAMENLRAWSDAQELFFAHIRYVVAGEAGARAGLGELLDYFARSTQTTLEIPLLVVRGGEARRLITASSEPGRDVTALLASMQRDAEQTGTARCFTLRQVIQRLSRSGAALCCAVESRPTGENAPSARDSEAMLCAGYAVLKDASLIGYLDTETALGADLIMGLAGQADYVLPCAGGSATVTLLKSEAHVSPARDRSGAPILLVTACLRAGLLSADGVDTARPAVRHDLETALARAAAAQIRSALAACRELDADFLELRRSVRRKDPAADDPDFLRTLRWQVRAEAEIERSYDLDGCRAYG